MAAERGGYTCLLYRFGTKKLHSSVCDEKLTIWLAFLVFCGIVREVSRYPRETATDVIPEAEIPNVCPQRRATPSYSLTGELCLVADE